MYQKMSTEFIKLNENWNAEPNAPMEAVRFEQGILYLTFNVNPWLYEGYEEDQRVELRFHGCSSWRLGSTNDEGWYMGQCRFSKLAPEWGEFYEIRGDKLDHLIPDTWNQTGFPDGNKRYLFYLRDSTFECQANSFEYVSDLGT